MKNKKIKEEFEKKMGANSDWVDKEKTENSQEYVVFNSNKIWQFIQKSLNQQRKELRGKIKKINSKDYSAWGGQEALCDLKANINNILKEL